MKLKIALLQLLSGKVLTEHEVMGEKYRHPGKYGATGCYM